MGSIIISDNHTGSSPSYKNCPNCNGKYPSLSAVEMQKHYSHCISCNERLMINDYISEHGNMYDSDCPKCGQPNPIRARHVHFPPRMNPLLVPLTLILIFVLFIVIVIWTN